MIGLAADKSIRASYPLPSIIIHKLGYLNVWRPVVLKRFGTIISEPSDRFVFLSYSGSVMVQIKHRNGVEEAFELQKTLL